MNTPSVGTDEGRLPEADVLLAENDRPMLKLADWLASYVKSVSIAVPVGELETVTKDGVPEALIELVNTNANEIPADDVEFEV